MTGAVSVWGQGEHRGSETASRPVDLSVEKTLGFKVRTSRELPPQAAFSSEPIQLEYGWMSQGTDQKKAIRMYTGGKGKPSKALELFATQGGKARTLIAAKRACEKLIPLSKWRLATFPEMMAFFIELAEDFSLPKNPNRLGRMFWASTGDEQKDKNNKETFLTVWEEEGQQVDLHPFTGFLNNVRTSISKAPNQQEKKYYIDLLKKTREGIPTICVREIGL
ncbi:MAG: hypothetical protein EBQ85_00230, partial [Proteobacteria bacterium]|nr:hypothetical protein [Pseudomonadota bacterium]